MTGLLQWEKRRWPLLLFGVLAGLVVAGEHWVVHRVAFHQHPELLPGAVAFDLLVGLPALFYGLVVRRYRWPLSTVGGAFGVGLGLCRWLVPGLPLLAWAGGLAQALEVLVLGYTLLRLRQVAQRYRAARQQSPHFLENLEAACRPVLGQLAAVLVTEAAVLRYGLLGRWAPLEAREGEQPYSTCRNSGFGALLATLGGITVVEGLAAHLLVAHWQPVAAWGLTAASAYSLLWLLAHGRAVHRRPVLLTRTALTVRVGFGWRATIDLKHLAAARAIGEVPAAQPGLLNVARLLLTPPNVLLTLAEPQVVRGLFGAERMVSQLAFYVDEPDALLRQLAAGRP